jgi:hypothetical protein
MDFGGLVSILQRKQVYFSSLDQLDDPHEGYSPLFSAGKIAAEGLLGTLATLEDIDWHTTGVVDPGLERERARVQKYKEDLLKRLHEYRAAIAVNCWHCNDDESVSMWQLYAKQRGVALETSLASLKAAFAAETRDIAIAEVLYCNSEAPQLKRRRSGRRFENVRRPIALYSRIHALTKRSCFSYEREIRALLFSPDQNNYVNVDLRKIIGRVWVSPLAPKFMEEVVRRTLHTYGMAYVPVIRSSLFDPISL